MLHFHKSTCAMNYSHSSFFLLLLVSIFSCKSTTNVNNSAPQPLFLENSNNWVTSGDASWTFENGVLIGDGEDGYITSKDAYSDFVLTAEFYPDEKVNSGIFIRCPKDEVSATNCYEINIWDDHVNQDYRTGSIVTYGKPLAHIQTVNKWNTYKVQAQGNRIQVWLNGSKTADLVSEVRSQGHIVLQASGGVIQFKNVKIQ